MNYLYFTEEEQQTYPVCLLVPSIRRDEIQRAYFEPFGIDPKDFIVIDLPSPEGKKKLSMSVMKEYITNELVSIFEQMEIAQVVVADGEFFKALTGAKKAEAHLGYVMDCQYGKLKAVYVPNYKAIFHDPVKVKAKIAQGMNALKDYRDDSYTPPGDDVLKFQEYPHTDEEIEDWLVRILDMDCPVTIDLENFSLKHHEAGIGTVAISWNQHEGIAFPVDYVPIPGATAAPFGKQVRNEYRRKMLRAFFEKLKHKAIYHNIAYDVYVLIYQLYMKDILDTEGLLHGMSILLRDWDCTKLISYLATNSCAGNKLGLKDQSQEFAGNYALDDIKDITRIPLDRLLTYNLVDSCSTWYVHNKHYQTMVKDQQLDIYENLFKPSTLDIIQMQLTGMPINKKRTRAVRWLLYKDRRAALKKLHGTAVVKEFTYLLNEKWVEKRNSELKVKRVSLADAKEVFNPNSDPQMRSILYDMLGLPHIDFTKSKLPATGGKTLAKLLNHTDKQDVKDFLEAMIAYAAVDKILTSFIPAMMNAAKGPDGWHYLFGNFNLGGTVSGRLSSSDPNLQNLPANSKYAKLIKSCFQAPPGWLFLGLDFASLEDRISALTTKDPNKLKVYTDGYDGHSLRCFYYFRERMIGIEDTVESINSIQFKYKHDRFLSKAPTFALTYQGTYITLMRNCGFSEEMARQIETRYHELYVVSDKWVASKLDQASKEGYVTAAFGLRVRTPLLHQVIRGTSRTPKEAEAEGRTAGNALGQSWCLLNSRAANEFMAKVRESKHRLDIRPCAQIHDAQYYLVRNDIEAVSYTNKHLVKAVQWQEHPDIAHDEVKLGGEVSIFYPTWAEEIVIPNGINDNEIFDHIDQQLAKRKA